MKTIGELLKDYRNQKKDSNGKILSQLDLTYIIGWENPSTLSRIESNKVLPTRDTIIRIAKSLEMDKKYLNHILSAGNYKSIGDKEYQPSEE